MTTFFLVAFASAILAEAVGTAAFLAIYLRDPAWRDTAVGRHLAFYSGALLFLLVLALTSFVVPERWLAGPILVGHVAFIVLIWQRVWLVWRARHRQESS